MLQYLNKIPLTDLQGYSFKIRMYIFSQLHTKQVGITALSYAESNTKQLHFDVFRRLNKLNRFL